MLHRMIACALALVAGTASAQTVGERSPAAEEMAALYIKTFINFDTGSVRKINDRLRSLHDGGQDSISVKVIESIEPENIADTAATLKQEAKVKNAKLHSAIDSFSHSLWGALKRSRCSVTGSVVNPSPSVSGDLVAAVKYECLVPDLDPGLAALTKAHGKLDQNNNGRSAAYFNQLSKVYSSSPLTHRLCLSLDLYHTPKYPGLWSTSAASDITRTMATWLVFSFQPIDLRAAVIKPCQPAA